MAPAAQSTAPLKTDWSERYELIGKIGSGGFAEVYEAQDTVLDRRVALKIAPGGHDMTARVLREVQAAAALSYPGIVALYDWFTDGERSYIVWELVQGDSLDRLPERLGDSDVVALGIELMEALAHAHSQGIVHRDIKPQNVMLDEAGHVKVMDFGIALLSDTDTLTGEGDVIGTVAYMSPEQAAGRRVGPPTDVYSAGMVLYELLAGEHPLRGETPAQTLANVSAARLPSLGTLRPDLAEELVALIDEACSERPGARPTAAELGAALDELRESGVLLGRRLKRLRELTRPLLRIGPAAERAGGAGLATVAGLALLRALPAYPQSWTLPLLAAGAALWAVVPQAGLAWLLGMLAFPFFNVAFSVGIAYLACAVAVFLLARTRPIIVVWPVLAPLLAPVYLSLLAPAAAFVFGRIRGPLVAAWAGVVVFVAMLLTRERGMLSAFEARRPLAGTVAGAGDPVTVVLRLLESLVPAGLAQAGAWAMVAVALGFAFRTPKLEQRLWIWSLSFSGLYVFYALTPSLVLGGSVDLTVLSLNVAAVAGVILLPLTLMAGGEPEEQDDEHLQGD